MIAKQDLYEELKEDSTKYSGSTILENFVLNNENSSIGNLYETKSSLKAVSEFPNAHFIAEKDSIIRIISELIFELDSLSTIDTINSYINQRENLVAVLNAELTARTQLVQQNQSIIDNSLANASIKNSQVIPSGIPEENEKFINEIEIIFNDSGKDGIANYYIDILEIANQCPAKGGKGVFRARTFASLFNDSLIYDDRIACFLETIFKPSSEKETSEGNIRIIPNPANNKITITLTGEYEGICEILITDILGKLVHSSFFDCSDRKTDISTKENLPGVYNVIVKINAKFVEQEKLVIIR